MSLPILSLRRDAKEFMMMTRWRGMILAGFVLLGCDSKDEEKKGGKHEHKPPHQGTLVELGEEFAHLELVLDSESGQLTGYVLDGEAEKPVRIEQREIALRVKGKPSDSSVVLKATGNPLTGEKPGDTSEFRGQANALKGLKEFDAAVAGITVKGKDFKDVSFNFPKGNEGK
jgi:hypothetical protein